MPTIEEVMEYAEAPISYHVASLAGHLPRESREDLAQDARARVCEVYPKIDREAWRSFIEKHVRGAVLDSLRRPTGRKGSKNYELRRAMDSVGTEEPTAEIVRVGSSPPCWDDFERILSLFPKWDAQILRLYYGRGLTHREIAGIFGVTEIRTQQVLEKIHDRARDVIATEYDRVRRGLVFKLKARSVVKFGAFAREIE